MQRSINTREKAKGYLKVLSGYHDVDKCRQCECLQGVLLQLKQDWPELSKDINNLVSSHSHKCLGCNPCPPANVWVDYLKERDK